MRPRNDIAEPDVAETLLHIQTSADRWRETAERLARQRDDALELVEAQRVVLSTVDAILDARDITAQEALDAIGRELDTVLGIAPAEDGVSPCSDQ